MIWWFKKSLIKQRVIFILFSINKYTLKKMQYQIDDLSLPKKVSITYAYFLAVQWLKRAAQTLASLADENENEIALGCSARFFCIICYM